MNFFHTCFIKIELICSRWCL